LLFPRGSHDDVQLLAGRTQDCGTRLGIDFHVGEVPPGEPGALLRPKIEKECPDLPTAMGFLLSYWLDAFSSILKMQAVSKK
jgi:hypothetical protein